MRRKIKIPRVLKIREIRGSGISLVFNNGESRTVDVCQLLKHIGISESVAAGILYRDEEIARAELRNNTLSWPNVEQYITRKNGEKQRVPFEIGADVLYAFSIPDRLQDASRIGSMIRKARVASGFTQEELARKSGTTRTYISRIENNRSDLELATLQKIVETGLEKRLVITINDKR
ncbi:MAG: helix-turn-helix transcriptional regulator [Candidatus Marinimicrobia bacterium]|nr:helix-turn-helix transcriptional regulator [Candidatus Neomarinimicrobiota bacterium]